jgi:hypothetical protein
MNAPMLLWVLAAQRDLQKQVGIMLAILLLQPGLLPMPFAHSHFMLAVTLMQVFADEVAGPLSLSSTYWINTNSMQQRPANPHMSVGCISTPADLCAITRMLANGGSIPSNNSSSSSSSSGEVLLQPELFDELVKLQSAGDPQDLSWAFACVQNGEPIPAVSMCGSMLCSMERSGCVADVAH